MKKLAIITTHPIQYNAPLFRKMTEAALFDVKVFYTWGAAVLNDKFDPGFGKKVKWDIDLLKGYEYEFVENIAKHPGSHAFSGIDNPELNLSIEAWGASAILLYGWKFKSHWRLLRYFNKKIPIIFRGDSTLLDDMSFAKKLIRKMTLRYVYKFVNHFLYVGKANKAYFKMAGARDKQLIFAPHAIDLSFFKRKSDPSSLRKELGISEESLVFLFAGKFETKKSVLLLLEVFNSLQQTDSFLIIAGDGVLKPEVEKASAHNAKVRLLPFQNQSKMPDLYNAADVFVLPSGGPNETWGLAVNEAMACGCAVLVSNACGCSADLVLEGRNGFVFSKNNKAELSAKMQWFIHHRSEIGSMSEKSLVHVEAFGYESMINGLKTILQVDV